MDTKNKINPELLSIKKLDCFCVNLTNRCNLSCLYCEHRGDDVVKKNKYDDCSLFDDRSFLKHVKNKFRTIQIAGSGEPTMHSKWQDILIQIDENKINSVLVTNLSKHFTSEDYVVLARLSRLIVSIDTVDTDALAEIRIHASAERIIYNIMRILETARRIGIRPPEIFFNCVVSDKILDDLDSLASMCIAMGAQGIFFNDLMIFPSVVQAKRSDLSPVYKTRPNDASRLASALRILNKNGRKIYIQPPLRAYLNTRAQEIISTGFVSYTPVPKGYTRNCPFAWANLVLQKNIISPCCNEISLPMSFKPEEMFFDINSDAIKELRREILTGNLRAQCEQCTFVGAVHPKSLERHVQEELAQHGYIKSWVRWYIKSEV